MMCRQTSRPMKSASASGPMGWFRPSLSAGVDVLGCRQALLVGAHRFAEEGHEDAVDDEARPVAADDDLLAQLGRDRAHARLGRVIRLGATDQLDERHDRHRAEEVHADEAGAAAVAARRRRGE